ncbi:hypothetical protein A9Q99_14700 [Gammaproteobacteria bacterium 45_16_T64]|nr:hypothetical protein A9Q99_14700 [Gammaproteobacteria bacterium 45_16_T64]
MVEAVGGIGIAQAAGELSLDALITAVLAERSDLLNQDVRSKIEEIKNKNVVLKQSNEILNQLRDLKQDKSGSVPQEVKDFFAEMGLDVTTGGLNDDPPNNGWENNIEKLKTKNESLTSTSQLDMVKLQAAVSKYNQTNEMLSNVLSKSNQSKGTLIGNMR